ncbi:6-carboxytetrahydropterin synthase, partial [Rhizobium johnstonii]|uniref:6-carboxytetrahydropterin synthase n=1 Tax=Rhizobium johnstonii TaxID=3019933 RepID=UPI003F99091E
MYRITKEFHLSSSHQLDHLPADHQCARLHCHNYVGIVEDNNLQCDLRSAGGQLKA